MNPNRTLPEKMTFRTGITAGEQKDLVDYLMFPLLDSLQKPTECLYQLVCRADKPVIAGASKPAITGKSKK